MEAALAAAVVELVKSGAIKGVAAVIVALIALGGYVAVRGLRLASERVKQEAEANKANEKASAEMTRSVDSLTTELRAGREAATREAADARQGIALLTQRVEALGHTIVAAIATDGEVTRAHLADHRSSDVARAAERAATVAATVAGVDVPDSEPPAPVEREREGRGRQPTGRHRVVG